jgi:membrane-bound lytic murein transglycosylase A
VLRQKARWVATGWDELPGWQADRVAEVWPALLRSCERPAAGWQAFCASARGRPAVDDASTRSWLEQQLRPYRVESLEGAVQGMSTGYYEPLIEASRLPRGAMRVPLHLAPADLQTRKPCRPPRPACADASSPTWPTRWTRWCCRSRARAACC